MQAFDGVGRSVSKQSSNHPYDPDSPFDLRQLSGPLTHSEVVRVKNKENAAVKKRRRFKRRICNFIRDFDRFGTPIPLNYQGSDTFKTVPGSFLSLVAYIILIVGLLKSFRNVVWNREWSVKQQNEIMEFAELNQQLDIHKYPNFQIGFELKLSAAAEDLTREEYLEKGRFFMQFFSVNEIGFSKNSTGLTRRSDKPQTNFYGIKDNKPWFYGHTHIQNASDDLNSQNYLEYKVNLTNSIISGSESYHEDITNNYISLLLSRNYQSYIEEIDRRCKANSSCATIIKSNAQIYNDISDFFTCIGDNQTEKAMNLDLLKIAYDNEQLWTYFLLTYYTLFESITVPSPPTGTKQDTCSMVMLKIGTNTECPYDNRKPADGSELSSKCLYNYIKDKMDEELGSAVRSLQVKPVVYDEITNFQDGRNKYPFRQRKVQSSAPRIKTLPFGKEQVENFKFTIRKTQVCMDDDIFAEFKVYDDTQVSKCNYRHDHEVLQVVDQTIEYLSEGDDQLMMGFTILMDNQVLKTEVRSYKFYDLLADNGGFFEALLGLFAFVGNPLSRIFFRFSVAKYAFYTRKTKRDLCYTHMGKGKTNYLRGGILDYSQIKALFQKIRFSLGFLALEPLLGCLICPCCKSLYKEKKLMDEANDKFEEELDVIGLVKRIRLSTDLWTQSLSLDQKKCLKFSKSNVVVQREHTPWLEKMKRKIKKIGKPRSRKSRGKKRKRNLSSSSSPEADSMSFSQSSRSFGSSSSDYEMMQRDLAKREQQIQEMNHYFQAPALNAIPLPIYKPADYAALEKDLLLGKSNSNPYPQPSREINLPKPSEKEENPFESPHPGEKSAPPISEGLKFKTFLDIPDHPTERKNASPREPPDQTSQLDEGVSERDTEKSAKPAAAVRKKKVLKKKRKPKTRKTASPEIEMADIGVISDQGSQPNY